jgi:hypothetical protein
MKINPATKMPYKIPACASAQFNLRLKPVQKNAIKKLSKQQKLSMSKKVLEMFDFYFAHAVPVEFWNDPSLGKPEKTTEKSTWDGMQKVWNFFKGV